MQLLYDKFCVDKFCVEKYNVMYMYFVGMTPYHI